MSHRTPEERRWATAIDAATFGVWDLDPNVETVHFSPGWKTRLGYPRIEAPDHSAFWRCRVHPDDLDPMLAKLRAHFDGSLSTYEMRFRLRCNGSGYRTMLSRGRVVARDDTGCATRMIGTMVDLTDRVPWARRHGLPVEELLASARMGRQPFHTHLAAAQDTAHAGGSVDVLPCTDLIDAVHDLLDIALAESGTAPGRSPSA